MAEETAAAAVTAPGSDTVTTTAEDTTMQTNGHAEESKDGAASAPTEDASAPTTEEKTEDAAAAPAPENGDDGAAAATAAAAKDNKRRKSGGAGVPEHKAKKQPKKKAAPTLHLDCQPGEYYWARLKGYPAWPAVICDEAMLPESLLATRPVSTARPDGSIREDFEKGGKNAKERTFPIMFMATNEFMWMINTSLSPLDPEECVGANTSKMTKALKSAYDIAAEAHPLQHWKDLLKTWQEEQEALEKERAEQEAEWNRAIEEEAVKTAESAEAKKKKASRKSKVGAEDGADDTETPKSSKKRKKEAESDAEGQKPKKTPKVTKLNGPKTPADEATAASTKKSSASTSSKPKKRVVSPPKEEELEVAPSMTEAERLVQREKHVLYLRHRLQKGFLTRDQAPQESEMPSMHEFFNQLEAFENLESSVVRSTKIHKVLKGLVKIASIPLDEQYYFKKRSAALLEVWNKKMEAEGEGKGEANGDADEDGKASGAEPVTNGDVEMKDADEEPKKEAEEEKETGETEEAGKREEEKAEEKVAAPTETVPAAAAEDKDGDAEMKTAEETTTA